MPNSQAGGGSVGIGEIFLQLNVRNNVAQQIGQQSNQAAQQAVSAFSGMGSRMGRIAGTVFKAFSVAAIVQFGKKCLDVASDLQEVQNVVDTAFGEMSQDAEDFAKTAHKQFGISGLAAKQMASTYMSMGKGMGLVSTEASKMSINVSKLAADTASFYNLDVKTASTKLKAIYTGETEGLKDLGIVMTQANLKAFAMSKGIKKNIKDMNQAELTTLRYHFVMQQLSLAQGDFSKTSGSWSNSIKSMGESFKIIMGNIGGMLIKVFTPVLHILSEVINMLAELTTRASQAFNKLFGGDDKPEKVVKKVAETGSAMAGAIEEGNNKIKKAKMGLAGFDELYTIGTDSDNGSGMFEGSGNAVADAFGNIEEYKSKEIETESLLDKAEKKIKAFWKNIAPDENALKAFRVISHQIGTNINKLIGHIIIPNLKITKDVFSDCFESISNTVKKHNARISAHFWGVVIDISTILNQLIGQIIIPAVEKVQEAFQTFWDEHGSQLFTDICDALGTIGGFVLTLWDDYLLPFVKWNMDVFGPVFGFVWNGIVDTVSTVIGYATDIIDFFVKGIKKFFEDAQIVLDNFSGAFQGLPDKIGKAFESLKDKVKGPLNWVIEKLNKFIDGYNGFQDKTKGLTSFLLPGVPSHLTRLPMLANGGIVDQPTVAMIGEGKHSEAVVPLDGRLEAIVAKAVAEAMAQMTFNNHNDDNRPIQLTVPVYVGTKKVTEEVVHDINRLSQIKGKPVINNF